MKIPHPIRARRERRAADRHIYLVNMITLTSEAFQKALTAARPEVEHLIVHAPRPKPGQIQLKGYLIDGQPVYLDTVQIHGQRTWQIPMRLWTTQGNNPLDRLELVFDYF